MTDLPLAPEKAPYSVSRAMLPLACPLPDMPLWKAHPRVYIPIEKTGEAACPYCGNRFVLVEA